MQINLKYCIKIELTFIYCQHYVNVENYYEVNYISIVCFVSISEWALFKDKKIIILKCFASKVQRWAYNQIQL